MRIRSNQKGAMHLALLCTAGLSLLSTQASAQQQDEAEQQEWTGEIFEIVVTSPRVEVSETRTGRGSRVSMSYAVRFADLDLRTANGRDELEERVREAANEICLLLSERYTLTRTGVPRCTRQAIDDAMPQVQAAFEAAEDQL